MSIVKWLLIAAVALPLLVLIGAQFGLLSGTRPADLGVREGRLKAPSSSPNSVSSQAALHPTHPQLAYAKIEPLPVRDSGEATLARLEALVAGWPGGKVISREANYLLAEFSTPLMKYTDDVEFWFDASANVVHVRSASRLGRKDFGANRARVEALRAALAAAK
jgi:uncharacterized protein (DUF1499 family)